MPEYQKFTLRRLRHRIRGRFQVSCLLSLLLVATSIAVSSHVHLHDEHDEAHGYSQQPAHDHHETHAFADYLQYDHQESHAFADHLEAEEHKAHFSGDPTQDCSQFHVNILTLFSSADSCALLLVGTKRPFSRYLSANTPSPALLPPARAPPSAISQA